MPIRPPRLRVFSFIIFSLLLTFASNKTAFSQPQWSFFYQESVSDDEMSTCNAWIEYNNGAFLVRFAGENVDFLFLNNEIAVPANQDLGTVIFSFAQSDYRLSANSRLISGKYDMPLVNWIGLFADIETAADIVVEMKYGHQFEIFFPDGTGYVVELKRSSRALDEALHCWETRPTGFRTRNPFENSARPRNPFE